VAHSEFPLAVVGHQYGAASAGIGAGKRASGCSQVGGGGRLAPAARAKFERHPSPIREHRHVRRWEPLLL